VGAVDEERREPARRRAQGQLEAQVLAALRTAPGPVTAGWVRERLGATLAYTTVITILTRLQGKHAVTRERVGRSFTWTAASDEAGLAAHRMRRVLDGESDREAVLASFVSGLTAQDERLLRTLLRRTEGDTAPEEPPGDPSDASPEGRGR
jgi:predicted transcriptional regulator